MFSRPIFSTLAFFMLVERIMFVLSGGKIKSITASRRDGGGRSHRPGEQHADVPAGRAVVQKRWSLLVRHRWVGGNEEFPHGNSTVAAQVPGDLQERSDQAAKRRSFVRDARHRKDDAGQSDRRRVRRKSN